MEENMRGNSVRNLGKRPLLEVEDMEIDEVVDPVTNIWDSDIRLDDLEEESDAIEIEYDSWDMFESMWSSHESLEAEILWKCLQFCYLFPKNYEFRKDDIIQIWVAQGFFTFPPFEETNSQVLEDASLLYFEEFERRHIFRFSGFDYSTDRLRYRLNHSIVDLLQQRHDDEYFRTGDALSNISENTLHCSLCNIDPITLENLYRAKQLRTLLILHEHESCLGQVRFELFLRLPLLRVLDFSHTTITELPSTIGNLKDLRYLNLSGTPITTLPNSVCNLYQMRTLKLSGCLKLIGLPNNMRKLRKLRHLDVDLACLLVSMPPGFGDLTELQSLPAFVIGKEDGCHITELKRMVNLHGTLRLLRLENVSSLEEAIEASLNRKKYIHTLELQWADLQDRLEILENLQPHTDLRELQIVNYGGAKFPSWIGDPVFSRLVTIALHDCRNCELLPPLGKLPFLYDLCISKMHKIKTIGHQFYGRNIGTKCLDLGRLELGTVSENLGKEKMFTAFPRLEKLTLSGMPKLEEWNGMEEGDFPQLQKLSISGCSKLTALTKFSLFKSLQQLKISFCPSLESFPNKGLPTSLQHLSIIDSPLLKEWFHREVEENCRIFARIPNVWIDYQQISPIPFGMSRRPALAQVTAQAAQSQSHFHMPNEYPSSVLAPSSTSLDQQTSYGFFSLQMQDPRNTMTESLIVPCFDQRAQSPLNVDKPADDGYRWRKYGQKQVKNREFPRSYYKCNHPNCAVKKKVVRSLDGYVTDIVYKGQHNHQPPQHIKRSKDGNSNSEPKMLGNPEAGRQDHGGNSASSIYNLAIVSKSNRDRESSQETLEQLSGSSDSEEVGNAETRVEDDEDQPDPKKRNTEIRVSEPAASRRAVTKIRTILQTTSVVDILDDGHTWRKYGQKPVKGNCYPRSYYKCTSRGCPARKHVERSETDAKVVVTTYEGKHNHDVQNSEAEKHAFVNTMDSGGSDQQAEGKHNHDVQNSKAEKHAFVNETDSGGSDQQAVSCLTFN